MPILEAMARMLEIHKKNTEELRLIYRRLLLKRRMEIEAEQAAQNAENPAGQSVPGGEE